MMVKIGMKEVLMMVDVDIGLKRPYNIPLTIWKKLLMLIGEVDIGPTPDTLPPINQITMVDCCRYIGSRRVYDSVHENVRVDSRGGDGRYRSRSQDINHSYFHKYGEIVYGDSRSGYRPHTSPSPSHHSGNFGRLLGFSIHGHEISENRSQTSRFSSYNHGGLYIVVSRSGVRRQKFFRIVKGILKLLLQLASKAVESALYISLYFDISNAHITNTSIN